MLFSLLSAASHSVQGNRPTIAACGTGTRFSCLEDHQRGRGGVVSVEIMRQSRTGEASTHDDNLTLGREIWSATVAVQLMELGSPERLSRVGNGDRALVRHGGVAKVQSSDRETV